MSCSHRLYSLRSLQNALSASRTAHCLGRSFHIASVVRNYEQKYLDKLKKKADEQGVSLDKLKSKAKAKIPEVVKIAEAEKLRWQKPAAAQPSDAEKGVKAQSTRRDHSPVKPLADIMNLQRILSMPHTADQIGALWTAYHSSLSRGTGRGYLSAVVPMDTYNAMLETAKQYPTFLLPLRREVSEAQVEGATKDSDAFEFYFMEWTFYSPPRPPQTSILDPIGTSLAFHSLSSMHISNPEISTVIFTPLQEYKLRKTFATPHLVLTHYTDLAHSHGIVLLRGELTPRTDAVPGTSYLLRQHDAQILALGIQRFYLGKVGRNSDSVGSDAQAEDGPRERAGLLRAFHEDTANFDWKKLLKHADPTRP